MSYWASCHLPRQFDVYIMMFKMLPVTTSFENKFQITVKME